MPPDEPMLPLPKSLPALVEEDCGGGFSICDAVGARDWRIEYVRCISGDVIESSGNIDVSLTSLSCFFKSAWREGDCLLAAT
jgi:hypothetical protein